MNSELFDRLKRLAKKEGKIVFADDDDAFVILPLLEYEMLADNLYGEECEECEDENCDCHESHDFDFGEDIFVNDDDKKLEDKKEEMKDDEADKDLIRKVNEDIAKWREEQQEHGNNEEKKQGSKKEEITDSVIAPAPRSLGEVGSPSEGVAISSENEKNEVLTEEERYYLEPLE